MIEGCVLPHTEWFISRRFYNAGAELFGMFKMSVHVFNSYMDVLVDLLGMRSSKVATLLAQHDGAFSDRELRVEGSAIAAHKPKALRESKRSAEPIDGLAHVFVDQDRNNACSGCRPVDNHEISACPLDALLSGLTALALRRERRESHFALS